MAMETLAVQRNSRDAEIQQTVETVGRQLNDSSNAKVQRDWMMQDLERLILAAEELK